MKTVINNSTLKFLSDIAKTIRDWFQTNKDFYLEAQENMHSFIDNLILELINMTNSKLDPQKKPSPIYSDMRFSKDKTRISKI
jgi:uncharacterized protein (DUF2461 family)